MIRTNTFPARELKIPFVTGRDILHSSVPSELLLIVQGLLIQ